MAEAQVWRYGSPYYFKLPDEIRRNVFSFSPEFHYGFVPTTDVQLPDGSIKKVVKRIHLKDEDLDTDEEFEVFLYLTEDQCLYYVLRTFDYDNFPRDTEIRLVSRDVIDLDLRTFATSDGSFYKIKYNSEGWKAERIVLPQGKLVTKVRMAEWMTELHTIFLCSDGSLYFRVDRYIPQALEDYFHLDEVVGRDMYRVASQVKDFDIVWGDVIILSETGNVSRMNSSGYFQLTTNIQEIKRVTGTLFSISSFVEIPFGNEDVILLNKQGQLAVVTINRLYRLDGDGFSFNERTMPKSARR